MKFPNFYYSKYYDSNFKNPFERCGIDSLKGKVITGIEGLEKGNDQVEITTSDGYIYILYHEQDCCESVWIEDVYGDVNRLIGRELSVAEERTDGGQYDPYGSHTWTFYTLANMHEWVDVRWLGESNGYYSESVDIVRIKLPDKIHSPESSD